MTGDQAPTGDPSVRIRTATRADVRAIAEFHTACWREAYRGVVPQGYLDGVTVADRAVRWRQRLAPGGPEVAVAVAGAAEFGAAVAGQRQLGEVVVGVARWGRCDETDVPAPELMTLYVHAAQRGTGLAARLLRRGVGAAPAHLWVFSANSRAQAFYRKHGFCADGHQLVDPDTGLVEERYVRPG